MSSFVEGVEYSRLYSELELQMRTLQQIVEHSDHSIFSEQFRKANLAYQRITQLAEKNKYDKDKQQLKSVGEILEGLSDIIKSS